MFIGRLGERSRTQAMIKDKKKFEEHLNAKYAALSKGHGSYLRQHQPNTFMMFYRKQLKTRDKTTTDFLKTKQIELKGKSILVVFGVPVAVWLAGDGFYKTDASTEKTTTKYMNAWFRRAGVDPKKVQALPQENLDNLLEENL